MKRMWMVTMAAVMAVLMSSCIFSDNKAPRIFVLTPTAQPSGAEGYPVVRLASVNLPNHLKRIEAVQMTDAGEIKFFSSWQWGDRFQDCVQNVLNRNLIQIMGLDNVCDNTLMARQKATVEVSIVFDICQFSTEKNTLCVKGYCICKKNISEAAMMPFELNAKAGTTPESIVSAYNELLCQLAEKLAEHLRSK